MILKKVLEKLLYKHTGPNNSAKNDLYDFTLKLSSN